VKTVTEDRERAIPGQNKRGKSDRAKGAEAIGLKSQRRQKQGWGGGGGPKLTYWGKKNEVTSNKDKKPFARLQEGNAPPIVEGKGGGLMSSL